MRYWYAATVVSVMIAVAIQLTVANPAPTYINMILR